jgi:hypothetical protein
LFFPSGQLDGHFPPSVRYSIERLWLGRERRIIFGQKTATIILPLLSRRHIHNKGVWNWTLDEWPMREIIRKYALRCWHTRKNVFEVCGYLFFVPKKLFNVNLWFLCQSFWI